MEKPKINVCVCTYLRTKHLEECLISLVRQDIPKDASYLITVIDNDKNESAKPIVDNLQIRNNVSIHYFCEKNRGIPFARNRALKETLELDIDYIAFIDDDEQAAPGWLNTIYSYLRSFTGYAVIHGRVMPKFPENTPQHLSAAFYTKKERRTGTQLQTCATNNVIFSTEILRTFNLSFDNSEPFAGGTDTKFFFEINGQGIPIYECAEAIVYEKVFPNRLKMSWMIHRKYRSGITTAWRRLLTDYSRVGLTLRSLSSLFFHLVLVSITSLFFQRTLRNKHLLKAARSLGILAGTFNIKTNSYANVDM